MRVTKQFEGRRKNIRSSGIIFFPLVALLEGDCFGCFYHFLHLSLAQLARCSQ
jgi:hypothetical protein